MKKTSIHRSYWFTMVCYIFALICGVVGSILILIYANEFIDSLSKIQGLIFIIGITFALIFLAFYSLKTIIILLKDFSNLKNNEYVSIIGKVIAFKKNRDPDSGMQINNNPIVLILGTKDKIELLINDKIMIGETYKFNYLKNCKIAEIVEKIQDL